MEKKMKEAYSKPLLHIVDAPWNGAWTLLEEKEQCDKIIKCKEQEDNRLYRANPDLIERKVGDEWILVPVGRFAEEHNCMISLNATSSFLWNQFREPNTLKEVLGAAKEHYEDVCKTMDFEVREFVREYVRMQLLQVVE